MTDTTPTDVEPYDLDWLAPDGRIREIITRYNNPDSPQRKLLATLDLVWDRQRELEAIVRDLAARGDDALVDIDPEYGNYICVDCPDDWCEDHIFNERDDVQHSEHCLTQRAVAWVSAHPVSGDQQKERAADEDVPAEILTQIADFFDRDEP